MLFKNSIKLERAESFPSTALWVNHILADIDYRKFEGLLNGSKCSPRQIQQSSHVSEDQIEALVFKTSPSFLPDVMRFWLKDHLPQKIFNWLFAVDFKKPLSAAHCKCLKKYIAEQRMPDSAFSFISSESCASENACKLLDETGIKNSVHETQCIEGTGDCEFNNGMEKVANNLVYENEKLNNPHELIANLNKRCDKLEKDQQKIREDQQKIREDQQKIREDQQKIRMDMEEIEKDQQKIRMDMEEIEKDQQKIRMDMEEMERVVENLVVAQVLGIVGEARNDAGHFDDEDARGVIAKNERS